MGHSKFCTSFFFLVIFRSICRPSNFVKTADLVGDCSVSKKTLSFGEQPMMLKVKHQVILRVLFQKLRVIMALSKVSYAHIKVFLC